MSTTSYHSSTGAAGLLEPREAETCQSSEATWLPLLWQPPPPPPEAPPKSQARSLRRLPGRAAPELPDSLEPPLVASAKQYIEDHYMEDLSLQQVAAALRTVPSELRWLFELAVGMDFFAYLARIRVEKAKTLLLNPNYYLSEISSASGFESLDQFNQAFKKTVGEAPHRYRARLPAQLWCMSQISSSP
jgi:AraC-like DNA-binding protein